ncbi:MAG: lysophospholipid acyltransferase family protein [Nitrospira sp.]|nr:lysophospholipid acyltransferase family protein [Nitrospira sp.]
MSTVVYGILWILARVVSRVVLSYRTRGVENVPATGGVLLAANHASYADIPLLGCGVRRRLFYLGRANLFPWPLAGRILRSLGWIPLRTERWDRKAFGSAVELLKAGKAVVIFPEGTRTLDGALQPGKPGIGRLVAQAQCSVVPVYLRGTFQVLPTGASWLRRHPVEVSFGESMDFREECRHYQGKELYERISQTVMARIAELRGVDHSAVPTT